MCKPETLSIAVQLANTPYPGLNFSLSPVTSYPKASGLKVIVTGGAGFIGSSTCACLAAAGVVPVTIDDLSTGHADNVRWGPHEPVDLLNAASLSQVVRDHAPVAIIHFAASAYVGESTVDPEKYFRNNVGGTLNLLSTARMAGIRHVVFSSSCATYGVPDALPITEDTPQVPINPYGRTKLAGEWMLRDFALAYGLSTVSLRYFNAAGADVENGLFERHDPETHLIPRVLMAAAGTIPAIEVFGTDYPTPDGTCIRDYIHVRDLARAHVMALRFLLEGGGNVALNLGTGRGTSVRDILSAVERLSGRPVPVTFRARREGDPAELVADPALARRVLGFEASQSDLDTIIRSASAGFGLALL
jgi:UDP-arabinose 4-epimerase